MKGHDFAVRDEEACLRYSQSLPKVRCFNGFAVLLFFTCLLQTGTRRVNGGQVCFSSGTRLDER